MGKTSTAVKQKYLDKTYTPLSYREKKDTAKIFKELVKKNNDTIANVFSTAVDDYIKKHTE